MKVFIMMESISWSSDYQNECFLKLKLDLMIKIRIEEGMKSVLGFLIIELLKEEKSNGKRCEKLFFYLVHH